jgi:hypothetical protein
MCSWTRHTPLRRELTWATESTSSAISSSHASSRVHGLVVLQVSGMPAFLSAAARRTLPHHAPANSTAELDLLVLRLRQDRRVTVRVHGLMPRSTEAAATCHRRPIRHMLLEIPAAGLTSNEITRGEALAKVPLCKPGQAADPTPRFWGLSRDSHEVRPSHYMTRLYNAHPCSTKKG